MRRQLVALGLLSSLTQACDPATETTASEVAAFTSVSGMPHQDGVCPDPRQKIQGNIPPNGSGFAFDKGCNTAFILPPITGDAELKALARSTNLSFCPS